MRRSELSSTGSVILLYLSSNGFTIDDLVKECTLSSRTIVRVIKDECKLPVEVALAVHSLIPEIEPSFLMSYDAQYQFYKGSVEKENNSVDIDECVKQYRMEKL